MAIRFLYNPLLFALHHNATWRLAETYGFAAGGMPVPVGLGEAGRLAAVMPLALQQIGESYRLVGLVDGGLVRSSPLGVDGSWTGDAVPAALRYHPFRTIRADVDHSQRYILAVAADPDCVGASGGEPFFTAMAEPGLRVRALLRLLNHAESDREEAAKAAKHLASTTLLTALAPKSTPRGLKLFSLLPQHLDDITAAEFARQTGGDRQVVRLVAALAVSQPLFAASAFASGTLTDATDEPTQGPAADAGLDFLVGDANVFRFD
ncbi:MAG: SapC family protein [Bosea sp. (in: a-proteobacteria)]